MLWRTLNFWRKTKTLMNTVQFGLGKQMGRALLVGCLILGFLPQVGAQSEQQIVVTIKDFTFQTTQMPLQLHMPTLISIKNQDDVRHDFGSLIFQDTYTRVEGPDTTTYGTGVNGVFIEPGAEVNIRFTIDRPGQYQFQCSIHPEMKGEIYLVTVGAV